MYSTTVAPPAERGRALRELLGRRAPPRGKGGVNDCMLGDVRAELNSNYLSDIVHGQKVFVDRVINMLTSFIMTANLMSS